MGSFAQGALVEQSETYASGGTLTLVSTNKSWQRFTGTIAFTVKLPDATTLKDGRYFLLMNRTGGSVSNVDGITIEVQYDDGTVAFRLPGSTDRLVKLIDGGTSNGTWDFGDSPSNNAPLRMHETLSAPDQKMHFSPNQVLAADGTTLSNAPSDSTLPSFGGGSIDFSNETVVGSIVTDGAAFNYGPITGGNYIRMVSVYDHLNNRINTHFSSESASLGGLTDPGTLFDFLSGEPVGYTDLQGIDGSTNLRSATAATDIVQNKDIVRFGSGAGGGGGGVSTLVSIRWNGPQGSSPILEEDPSGAPVYKFEKGSSNKIVTLLKVPDGHTQTKQMFLHLAVASPNASSTFEFKTSSYIIFKDSDPMSSTNSPNDSTALITNVGGNIYREAILEITDSDGKINGSAVTAGTVVRIELTRSGGGGDLDTADILVYPDVSEVLV